MAVNEKSRERVIDLIRKLQAMAQSAEEIGNRAEAEAFAAKVSEMLLQYKLEMSDIELSDQDSTDPIEDEMVDFDRWNLEFKRTRVSWQETLAIIIGEANFCGILVQPKSNRIWFVGREVDRQVCIFLFAKLSRAMKYQSDWDYGQAYRKALREGTDLSELHGYKASWLAGCNAAIRSRLKSQRKALVVDNRGLALVKKADADLEEAMKKFKQASGNPRGRRADNMWGALAGIEFGDSVELRANALSNNGSAAKALASGNY